MSKDECTTSDKPLSPGNVKIGDWVTVFYNNEKYIGRVLDMINQQFQVRCLEKPFGTNVAQKLERENDAVFYEHVYSCPLKIKKCS